MKREEQVSSEFLTKYFNKKPPYEPLGYSTPPDFAIDGTAFEVWRLNQRYFHKDGSNEGLERIDIRLTRAMHRELAKIPLSDEGGTLFWGLRFRRPLSGRLRNIANQLAEAARDHYLEGSKEPREITAGGVTLDLFGWGGPKGRAFLMGYESDFDSGGMLGDIYPTSIRLALEEKIAKTKNIADKFSRWVLILVDDVLPGMME